MFPDDGVDFLKGHLTMKLNAFSALNDGQSIALEGLDFGMVRQSLVSQFEADGRSGSALLLSTQLIGIISN